MSWFPDIMDDFDEAERKHLRRFYRWVKENHPEITEEWMEKKK